MIATAPPTSRSRRILIVEDEEIVASDIEKNLEDLGFEVSGVASSAAEAIRRASEVCPDLAIMDVRIQGDADGIHVAEELRRRFDIPVVYVTAHGDTETLERAKKTEPAAFLIKPFKMAELQRTVQIALYNEERARNLREHERWLSTTLRSIGDGVISVDLSGTITYMNPAAELLTGVTTAVAKGRPVREVVLLVDQERRPMGATPLDVALRDGSPCTLAEGWLLSQADELHPVRVNASPVLETDRIQGAVLVLTDISEQEHLRNILRRQNETLEARVHERTRQLNRAMSDLEAFCYAIAHNLRAPLRAMHGMGDILIEDYANRPLDTTGIEYLERIREAALSMDRLIHDLLGFTTLPRGNINIEHMELEPAVLEALESMREDLTKRGAEVSVSVGHVHVHANPRLLSQSIAQLVSNAVKFVAPGTRPLVRIRAERRAKGVRLTVEDNGIGIPSEFHERIFAVFEQLHPREDFGGTGMGLAMVKRSIEAMGGEVSVESTSGVGSRFHLRLRSSGRSYERKRSKDPLRR